MEKLLPAKANQTSTGKTARRITGVGAVMLSVAGFAAADTPTAAFTRPSVSIERELVLQCPPGDIPTLLRMLPPRPDRVDLLLGCLKPTGEPDDIVGIKTISTGPIGPDDHVLRLSMTSAEGAPEPDVSLTIPTGGLSFVIIA